MKFNAHLQDNAESLIKSLRSRLGALKLVGKVASFKNRKMIAEGIMMSKLIYLISLWGGTSGYLIKSLQIIQTRAARIVTKLDWSTPTSELLEKCGWLSVQQLVIYHSVLLVYKVMKTESPAYLFSMFNTKYQYRTRQADSGVIKQMFCPKLTLTSHSFRFQAASHFNGLPSTIRNAETLPRFKQMVKKWIKENVPPS